jgi:septum formation protein
MSDTADNPPIHLVLASGSPRRMELLGQLGINYILLDHGFEETTVQGESPQAHVHRLAKTKAVSASKKAPEMWVLGADTIVVIDEKILGKPRDEWEARDMLASLAGKTHEVFTGYALVHASRPGNTRVREVRSKVRIRDLTPDEITAYVSTGEPMDKAGSYAIQGIGAGIVEWIQGSYTNVVGLPVCELAQDLKELGIFDFLLEYRKT